MLLKPGNLQTATHDTFSFVITVFDTPRPEQIFYPTLTAILSSTVARQGKGGPDPSRFCTFPGPELRVRLPYLCGEGSHPSTPP
jgi:hypothetical protein